MIYVVSGKLGSGKSYDCVRLAKRHIEQGGVVVSNISLSIPQIARASGRRLNDWQYVRISADIDPTLIPRGDKRGRGPRKVMVILDECLNWFESSLGAKDTRKAQWGEWLRQSDKLGQNVYFIAQNFDRAAKWIRELAKVHVSIIDLGDIRIFYGIIPVGRIIPGVSELYCRREWDVQSGTGLSISFHHRGPSVWNFYDTSETFGFQAAESAYKFDAPGPMYIPSWGLKWIVIGSLIACAVG